MKDYDWITSAVATQVCTAPVTISGIIVTPGSGVVGDVTLYDGESTGDPKILSIRTGSGETKVISFVEGLLTKKGLYLDVGLNVEGVLIQFIWGKE